MNECVEDYCWQEGGVLSMLIDRYTLLLISVVVIVVVVVMRFVVESYPTLRW